MRSPSSVSLSPSVSLCAFLSLSLCVCVPFSLTMSVCLFSLSTVALTASTTLSPIEEMGEGWVLCMAHAHIRGCMRKHASMHAYMHAWGCVRAFCCCTQADRAVPLEQDPVKAAKAKHKIPATLIVDGSASISAACMHACRRIHMHAFMHADASTCMHACMQRRQHACMQCALSRGLQSRGGSLVRLCVCVCVSACAAVFGALYLCLSACRRAGVALFKGVYNN